ncbi:hypothetical protein M3Y97_00255100 [Aphelenchoides bicaudatus]|nr:hypothetical protein M3Y97_00255100 [Aphelenchoides bicaudatus]
MFARSQFRLLIKVSRECRSYGFTALRSKEIRFSETGAYHGADKAKVSRAADLNEPLYIPNKYDSPQFQMKRVIYAVISVAVLFSYFAIFREPNDLDVVLNSEPHLITSRMQRYHLQRQIDQARAIGQNTELLEAELAYIDVREEAAKAKVAKQAKK